MFYQLHSLASVGNIRKEYGENFSFPPHLHYCFEIITLLSGEMTVTIDGTDYHLKKNDSLLIFPNQLHSLSSQESEHLLYIFDPKMVQAFNIKRKDVVPADNRLVLDDYLISLLKKLDENSSSIELKGLLYSICGVFDNSAQYTPTLPDTNNLLLKIFSFVDENFNGSCSLKDLSQSTGYDYAYLSRYFKRITGLYYNDYLNYFRLNNACYLLRNTTLSVIECAEECGYKSLRTFNRNFKECYGVSPSIYRKQS